MPSRAPWGFLPEDILASQEKADLVEAIREAKLLREAERKPERRSQHMIVNRKELLGALSLLDKVSKKNKRVPWPGAVKLSGTAARLVMETVDKECHRFAVTRIDGDGELEPIVVANESLRKIAMAAKGEEVTLGSDRNLEVAIASRKFRIEQALGVRDFPSFPVPRERHRLIEWGGQEFREALGYCARSVCRDETRPQLSLIAVIPEYGMCSTDGHRLAIAPTTTLDKPFGIPASHIEFLLSSRGDLRLELPRPEDADRGPHWHWSIGDGDAELFGITANNGEDVDASTYPPVRQVIPKNSDRVVRTQVKPLRESLALAAKTSEDPARLGTKFVFDKDELSVKTESFSEMIPLAVGLDGGNPGEFAANPFYIVDALPEGADLVWIEWGGELDPILLRSDNGMRAVVMPMRI